MRFVRRMSLPFSNQSQNCSRGCWFRVHSQKNKLGWSEKFVKHNISFDNWRFLRDNFLNFNDKLSKSCDIIYDKSKQTQNFLSFYVCFDVLMRKVVTQVIISFITFSCFTFLHADISSDGESWKQNNKFLLLLLLWVCNFFYGFFVYDDGDDSLHFQMNTALNVDF